MVSKTLLTNFLFFEKKNLQAYDMMICGEKNSTLHVMLIYYMKLYKYIHFLPLYITFCDHSKRIFTDWIMQWKKALQMHAD